MEVSSCCGVLVNVRETSHFFFAKSDRERTRLLCGGTDRVRFSFCGPLSSACALSSVCENLSSQAAENRRCTTCFVDLLSGDVALSPHTSHE